MQGDLRAELNVVVKKLHVRFQGLAPGKLTIRDRRNGVTALPVTPFSCMSRRACSISAPRRRGESPTPRARGLHVRDGYACIENTSTPVGVYDAPATLTWCNADPAVHGMWDVSLALKMTLRTDYYADAERFEIQGEEEILTVTRCSDRMLDEPALTLYRAGEVRAFHNLDSDWANSFPRSTRHFLYVLAGREARETLTAREGRRVIALYDLFQRSNAERRSISAWKRSPRLFAR